MAAEVAQVERTYGNWRRPRPPGLWHLGLISSVLLIVGLIAVDHRDRAGRPDPRAGAAGGDAAGVPGHVAPGSAWADADAAPRDEARLASRPREPARTCIAPGRWAARRTGPFSCLGCSPRASSLRRAIPMTGRSRCCATRGAEQLTVVLETEPDGAALVDQPQVDQWVAHYGQWIAALSAGAGAGRLPGVGRDGAGSGHAVASRDPGPPGSERAGARARDARGDRAAATRPAPLI